MINIVPADTSGCGYYRLMQQATLLHQLKKPVVLSTPSTFIGFKSDVTYTQRILSDNLFEKLIDFKKQTGTKFIIDYDDLIWEYKGESLPEYNLCRQKIDCKATTKALEKHLDKLADKITVTTETLKDSLSQFTDKPIYVMPNMLSYKEWYMAQSPAPKRESFMFAGSYTHFDNVNKQYGDFSKNMVQFLSNKEVQVKSLSPYFLKPKVTYPGSLLTTYANDFWKQTRDVRFIIAPLAQNVFNTCKSDLKYLECCALGRVCLASDFPGCPYSAVAHPYQLIPVGSTSKAIQYIVDRASEHYDEILQHQYQFLSTRWLDNHINEYLDILQ